jgi:hypothetical protein
MHQGWIIIIAGLALLSLTLAAANFFTERALASDGLPRPDAYLPVCCGTLVGFTGSLMGTRRVSLLPEADSLDVRKMASSRNMKISDSMVCSLAASAQIPQGVRTVRWHRCRTLI